MNSRIPQLDGIRGLASLTVLLHHLYLVFPVLPILFKYSPLRVMVNGHASVIMFFVLSGFVLAMPFLRGTVGSYRKFVVRRIFRIYIPYLVSLFLALIMASLLSNGSIPGIDAWQRGISYKLLVEHLLFILNTDTKVFNNVIWSLVHEMRISLLFPLIAFCVIRLNWKTNLLICLLLSSPNLLKDYFSLGYEDVTIVDTMHYTSMFIIGALLAKHKDTLVAIYLKWSTLRKWMLLIAVFPAYAFSTVISTIISKLGLPYEFVISDYAASFGSSIFIIYALGSIKLSKLLLLKKPVIFLGKISYSLYLIHLIVLFSFMFLFYGIIPNVFIYIGTVVISIWLATLSWRFIETPSIALGIRLTKTSESTLKSGLMGEKEQLSRS
jgi:peptidoglycan/LPS O-acetylase OafA/YrhL